MRALHRKTQPAARLVWPEHRQRNQGRRGKLHLPYRVLLNPMAKLLLLAPLVVREPRQTTMARSFAQPALLAHATQETGLPLHLQSWH
eukprot:scaffold8079_cov83-Alexandrium_tamarense.AAC.1